MNTNQKSRTQWIRYPGTVELEVDGRRVGGIPVPNDRQTKEWWEEQMRKVSKEAGVPFDQT